MTPYSVAQTICSLYVSFFLIILNEVFYSLFMNFKSHKVEFEEQYIFNVVLSALVSSVITENLFIN